MLFSLLAQKKVTKEMHPGKQPFGFFHSLWKNPLAIELAPLRFAQTKLFVTRIFPFLAQRLQGDTFFVLKLMSCYSSSQGA
jgi:hypothetical protein